VGNHLLIRSNRSLSPISPDTIFQDTSITYRLKGLVIFLNCIPPLREFFSIFPPTDMQTPICGSLRPANSEVTLISFTLMIERLLADDTTEKPQTSPKKGGRNVAGPRLCMDVWSFR
jgi:hypothetical protein